ncbi:MAG: hypothetical protein KatS3mg064_1731 [Tepidiforma sp.]|nr:MAG: hypothetical protein KatS3mg064_1731 [Tepidiforma sp.]
MVADNGDGMTSFPVPGTPVTVVLRSRDPAQWPGEVAAVRDGGVAVRIAGAMPAWDPNGTYVLVALDGSVRVSQPAAYIGHTERAVAFRSLGPWQPVDRRAHPRFAANYRAEVRSVLGNSRQDGRLVDISMGGMAVRVGSRPGGRQVQVRVWAGPFSSELLCMVVGAEEDENGVVLRLQYTDLLPAQRAFVRQVVEGLAGQGAAQAS